MKRLFAMLLTFALILAFAACTQQETAAPTEPAEQEFVKPENYATVLTVSINPKIRLYLDKDGVVLAVEPVNEDAKDIVNNMKPEDQSCDVVISAFITAANDGGFVKENGRIELEIEEAKDPQVDCEQILTQAEETASKVIISLEITVEVVHKPHNGGQKPTEATKPTEAPTQPTEPTQPTTVPTQPTKAPTKPTAAPTQPTKAPAQPTKAPTKPTAAPTQPTKAPTEPTKAPTKPTEKVTVPTECSHTYLDATCTAPKTCSKCGVTVGTAAGHSWQDATCTDPKTCSACGEEEGTAKGHAYTDGVCGVCGGVQENYKPLESGVWTCKQVVDGMLYDMRLSFKDESFSVGYGDNIHHPNFDPEFRDQMLQEHEQTGDVLDIVDGVYFYVGMGDGGPITYTVNGNEILVDVDGYMQLTITRTDGDKLLITESTVMNNPSDITLVWSEE